ncbi:MAG: hypothetical protein WCI47_03430 [bacterium]
MAKKSPGARAYEAGFKAGLGKGPKKKKPRQSTGGSGGNSGGSQNRETRSYPTSTSVPRQRQQEVEVSVRFAQPRGEFSTHYASVSPSTGEATTNLAFGQKGASTKGHISVTDKGETQYVRDSDGTVLYRKP